MSQRPSCYSALFIPWDLNREIEIVDVPYNINDFDRELLSIERNDTNESGETEIVASLILFNSSDSEINKRASFLKFNHIKGDAYLVWVKYTENENGEIISSYEYYRAFIIKDYEEILRKMILDKIGYYYLHNRGDNIFTLDIDKRKNPFPDEYTQPEWKGLAPKGLLDVYLNSSDERKSVKKEYFKYDTSKDEKGRYLFKMGLRLIIPNENEPTVIEYISDKYYSTKAVSEHNAALKFLKILHLNNIEEELGIKLVIDDENDDKIIIPYPYPNEIMNTYNNEHYLKIKSDPNIKRIDILNNNKMIKYIIKEGDGKYVPFSSICKIYRRILKINYFDDGHYESIDKSDEYFNDLINPNNDKESFLKPLKYGGNIVDIHKKSKEKLWHIILPSMKLGEISMVYLDNINNEKDDIIHEENELKPSYCYYLLLIEIPNHIESIELPIGHNIKKAKDINEKMKVAKVYKELGNKYYERKLFKLAYDEYKKGAITMEFRNKYKYKDIKLSDDFILLKHQIYMNIAASCLYMDKWIVMKDSFGQYDEALNYLNIVLNEDENNIKALIRRSKVYASLLEIEKANEDIEKALNIDPNIDKNIIESSRKYINSQLKKRNEKEKSIYKRIMK